MGDSASRNAVATQSVLVVDDNEAYCDALAGELAAHGYAAHTAGSAWEALRLLDRTDMRIDVLVSDIKMPPGQPHGFSIARMARHKRHGIRIIYLTAYPDLAEGDDGALLGTLLVKRAAFEETVRELLALLRTGD